MKNAILKNITVKADELANQYNKTKDPGIRDQWYKIVKEAAKHAPEEEEGYRINFKRRVDKNWYSPILLDINIKDKYDRYK